MGGHVAPGPPSHWRKEISEVDKRNKKKNNGRKLQK